MEVRGWVEFSKVCIYRVRVLMMGKTPSVWLIKVKTLKVVA